METTTRNLLDLEAMAQAAGCLKTLAHPHRLRMIQMLLGGEYTVGQLAEACGIAPHAASEHLGRMRDRGLLGAERRSREVYYQIAEQGLASIMDCIEKRFGGQ